MKTKGLTKVLIMGLALTVFTGCQEEEFYEKEYFDGAIEEFERKQKTIEEDDLAEQIVDEEDDQGINPGDSDSDDPRDDDGSGDNGSGDDGSGDNGSGDDGSGDNGSGDDGSGDDGSGDDGSGDNGSGDNGSGDNGSGDNGSGDDGSGDDGSGDDGSGDDGSGDDTDPVIIEKSDTFTQRGESVPVDILWVVDNSGSMEDEQNALAHNFNAFIKDFASKNIDFQMAITVTDRNRRKYAKRSDELEIMSDLTKAKMDANKDRFISDFKKHIKVGIRGYGLEKGLKASEVFSDIYANHWFREDAYLAIVYVTDERDQSEKSVANHLKQIAKWKKNAGLVKAYSIVDMDNLVSTRYILKGYDRYKEMSDRTGGYVANINDDFHTTLSGMGNNIANLSDQFPLSSTPWDANEIVVKVNGIESVEWEYDANQNAIKFFPGAVPADGSSIEVIYDIEE